MQNSYRWRLIAAVAAVTTAIGLVACSSGGSTKTSSVDSVTIAIPAEPTSLDGCDTQLTDTGYVLVGNVVEALTAIDPRSGKTAGQLATSWTQDSDKQWTFKLRKGVKFSNGEVFDANAAKWNIDRLVNGTSSDIKTCANLSNWAGEVANVAVVNSNTITITTSVSDPLLPTRLVWTNMEAPNATPTDARSNKVIGTGPYVLSSYKPTQNIQLTRNDNYWGTEPAMKKATFVWRTDSSVRADMVHTGEADIAINLAPQDVANDPNAQTYALNEAAFLRLDTDVAPLNDVRVRQAISESIDRKTIVKSLLGGGIGTAAQQFVTKVVNGFIPNYKGVPYSLTDAKELVASAKAAGVAVDQPIQLYDRGDLYPGESEVIQAVVADINKSGLNVKLNNVDAAAWTTQNSRPFPPNHPARIVSSASNNNTGDASFNFSTYMVPNERHSDVNDPKLADLVAQATAAPIGAKRSSLWQQAGARAYDQLYYLVPFAYLNALLTTSDHIDFKADSMTSVSVVVANIKSK